MIGKLLKNKDRKSFNSGLLEFDDYNYKHVNDILQYVVVTTQNSEEEEVTTNKLDSENDIQKSET